MEKIFFDIVSEDRLPTPDTVTEYTDALEKKYPFLRRGYIGKSILSRPIHIITLGQGKREYLYVAAHHGAEWLTTLLLLCFTEEYCKAVKEGERICGIDIRYLSERATLHIIPQLNPDGVEIAISGNRGDLLAPRRLKMNSGSEKFSLWQANARGVDLNHNYNCGFQEYKAIERKAGLLGGAPTRYSGEYPESEPESSALANFIRYRERIEGMLTLHSQGEEIYSGSSADIPRAAAIGRQVERATGYKLTRPNGTAAYGGLTDWFTASIRRPGYTLECGLGENPLPLSDLRDLYSRLRKLLFRFPTFV